jgi:Transcriptional regulator, AbiEi antitoxin
MWSKNMSCGMLSCHMNHVATARLIEELAAEQGGVLSTADLHTALGCAHPATLRGRIRTLEKAGVLRRFCRGWYTTDPFDPERLSQHLVPGSYISFGRILSRELLIGTQSPHQVLCLHTGRSRAFLHLGYEIRFLHVAPHLDFGWHIADGRRIADREKAALDTLYFHLRGRRFAFDIYSDIDFSRLDSSRVKDYLQRYRNPKFKTFAKRVMEL